MTTSHLSSSRRQIFKQLEAIGGGHSSEKYLGGAVICPTSATAIRPPTDGDSRNIAGHHGGFREPFHHRVNATEDPCMRRSWTHEALSALPCNGNFRLRGNQITRLEAITDAAFALALTHLVIAIGYVPRSYEELVAALKGIPAFAASIGVLGSFWYTHVRWSRNYGLEDGVSVLLTFVLLFVLLIFVYPLRIVTASFFWWLSGGWFVPEMQIDSLEQLRGEFVIFSTGFLALSLSVLLLFLRADRCHDSLMLNAAERYLTRTELLCNLIRVGISIAAIVTTWCLPANRSWLGPMLLVTLWIWLPWLRRSRLNRQPEATENAGNEQIGA